MLTYLLYRPLPADVEANLREGGGGGAFVFRGSRFMPVPGFRVYGLGVEVLRGALGFVLLASANFNERRR